MRRRGGGWCCGRGLLWLCRRMRGVWFGSFCCCSGCRCSLVLVSLVFWWLWGFLWVGGYPVLFGFVGFPAEWRAQNPERVLEMSRDQLSTMFGPAMAHPIAIRMQDWALNPAIATRKDQISPHAHPSYGLPPVLADLWSGRLMMASTELGRQFGGLLEGALEVADETASQIAATRMLHEARMSALSLRDGATETTP